MSIKHVINGCTTNGSRQFDRGNIVVPPGSLPPSPIHMHNLKFKFVQQQMQSQGTLNMTIIRHRVLRLIRRPHVVTPATGNNGCTSIATSTVEVSNDFPQMDIADPDILTCTVQQVNVTATIIGNESEYSYIWSTQNGSIISGQNSLIVTVSEEGTYTLSVTNLASGCSVTQSKTVNEISQAPSALFEVTLVETALLTANTSSIAPNNSYLWDFGNGTTSTQANTTTLYTSNEYNV
ncbi:MAG: hypothetical protein IPO92_24020 [Saprospiraceae bacterium]|nr:hypothetical protein [Saprospiraceae bacterium]